MDAWFDCAKMALSLPCKPLSPASWWVALRLPSSDFLPLALLLLPLFFPPVSHFSSDGKPTQSLILGRSPFCQEQTDCISSPFTYQSTLRFPLSFPASSLASTHADKFHDWVNLSHWCTAKPFILTLPSPPPHPHLAVPHFVALLKTFPWFRRTNIVISHFNCLCQKWLALCRWKSFVCQFRMRIQSSSQIAKVS